jgi:glyoxylase-like metal-dependent hydrolase (beta-lactamase superfamily II)
MFRPQPNRRAVHPFTGWFLYVLLAAAAPISPAAAVGPEHGSLVNPHAVPAGWRLPDNVIDTRQLPEFALAANTGDAATPLPVYRVAPDTYFLFGNIDTLDEGNRGWNGNAGFVVTDDGVVVIDTLGTPELGRRLLATIRSVTGKPIRYLIVTHNHPDHAYGAAAFQALDDVMVIGHPGTDDYNRSETLERSVAYRRELLGEDMRGFEPPQPDRYVEPVSFARYDIELGYQRFEIYNTGHHHSYGDLVVYQPRQQILWISDLAFNQRTTFMGDGDSLQIIEAQDWLLREFPDVRLMVPGHGAPQTAPFPMIEKTREYVLRLRRDMKQAVEAGVPLYDAVQASEFEDWKNIRLYEENHRANANFVYREMEQAFFENF